MTDARRPRLASTAGPFGVVVTLEWAMIAGMLGWVAPTAWCWRRAGASVMAAPSELAAPSDAAAAG